MTSDILSITQPLFAAFPVHIITQALHKTVENHAQVEGNLGQSTPPGDYPTYAIYGHLRKSVYGDLITNMKLHYRRLFVRCQFSGRAPRGAGVSYLRVVLPASGTHVTGVLCML